MEDLNRRLMRNGMFLFLLGLVTGLVQTEFANPRMGLSAHLEGVMNGMFLVALGAVWPEVKMSRGLRRGAYWSALLGTYGNWTVTTLAAIFGTGAFSPLAAPGRTGLDWQEHLVTVGFIGVAISIITASVLVLFGLRRVVRA